MSPTGYGHPPTQDLEVALKGDLVKVQNDLADAVLAFRDYYTVEPWNSAAVVFLGTGLEALMRAVTTLAVAVERLAGRS